jgi:hypothetical protein
LKLRVTSPVEFNTLIFFYTIKKFDGSFFILYKS